MADDVTTKPSDSAEEKDDASKCPECGVDLANLDPEGHAARHWGENPIDPARGKEAAARQRKLLDLAQKQRDERKPGGR